MNLAGLKCGVAVAQPGRWPRSSRDSPPTCRHGRVALASGPDFGAPGRGFATLNLGTSWALVEEAVDSHGRAVADERVAGEPDG